MTTIGGSTETTGETTGGRREIPPLDPNTILLVEVGSGAHGTGQEGVEDDDEIGIFVEAAADVILRGERRSVMYRTAPDGEKSQYGDVDRTMHPLRKFLRLALSGNPSILMCLWSPVRYSTPIGEELRELAPYFVGRHVVPAFQGYAEAQTGRLLGVKGPGGHGRRGSGGRPELIDQFGYDTKFAMHAARLGIQCKELLREFKLTYPIQGAEGDWLRDVRYGRVSFDDWLARMLELDADMTALRTDENLPEGPNKTIIDLWSLETHLNSWGC